MSLSGYDPFKLHSIAGSNLVENVEAVSYVLGDKGCEGMYIRGLKIKKHLAKKMLVKYLPIKTWASQSLRGHVSSGNFFHR